MSIRPLHFLFLISILFLNLPVTAQSNDPLETVDFENQRMWVDSIYNNLSLQEKVGQLFMVDLFSNGSRASHNKVRGLITEQHIGGVIFSKGGPGQQAKLNNEFQELAKVPLLIGMDAEWGLAMRLDSTFALPWNMTLGAVQSLKLIEEAGASISRHSRRLGVHINFAPVIDINTNPENPIIGNRAFGEEKINVTNKALAFMKGMHREGILSSAKHFPGHGDTNSDSHKTLPTISFSRARIDSTELFPYYKLIDEGVSSIMVAHLNVPGLEREKNLPSSLSKTIVTDLLKERLGFKGLIFTDALNMKGASNHTSPGDIDLAAFLAGNDILLISEDVPKASVKIMEAYNNGIITEERLSHSVKKILKAKYKAGLHHYLPVNPIGLEENLHTVQDRVLNEELFENAITIVKNDLGILPVKDLDTRKIAYVHFGDDSGDAFLTQLRKYSRIDHIKAERLDEMISKLREYNLVIIGYHKSNASPWARYKFSRDELTWIHEIAKNNLSILNVFTRPYALLDLNSSSLMEGIIMGYQNSPIAQEKTAQILFGALEARGKLPVSAGEEFPAGTGFYTRAVNRLSYGIPESVGLRSTGLAKIDSLVDLAISRKMTPGLQVMIARRGKVIYNRNAGYHTYEKKTPVTDTSLYDLASLTKILASLPLIMELEERGVINFDSRLGELMPYFIGSNKENIRLQDMLLHYGRLKAWLPFYVPTIDRATKRPSLQYYREKPVENFNLQVANEMYIRNDIRDSILGVIRSSSLEKQLGYKYSDLPFYIMKYYLEDHHNAPLDLITYDRFYNPLGANYTTYSPLEHFSLDQIVPTEEDKLWRRQRVHGFVHDQGAAMQGGIGGHAGLFSNANDVTKIMQLYLNGGHYGGRKYLEQETLEKFNTCYYCENNVRRGVGFDKPQLSQSGPTCGCVSLASFGHSGFTGTFAWADPDEEIVYVFLSNRTYPDVDNRALIRENIREKIQQVIYDSIEF
ncbi:beta-N-acetylglucosaminidase [Antarcticibacterium flavum]|uniref:beta-N-acetylhexosaminidase n=1 Tax=Antarcticibacterium flavum TaxID=2058175 RepID=A0A5B7X0A2_9FLAO|nr:MULTISPECIES: glycoside hydrolase family 3 N-terminal domain-containing protein [Antarcticibacterium]MCM4158851.1 beta-N-acetylglucosaminidase [Antarcticibacterium sp. W02-3]QCY68112.1 beta-N-acetylglucosaminidase [Antarcticibacterium flavum]